MLALFLYTPLTALFSWTQMADGKFRFQLYLLGDELLGAGKLWGYAPSAIGLALVPAALLTVEKALDPFRGASRGRRTLSRRVDRGALLAGSLAALLAAWLHPWQGITLILIFIGLGVWQRYEGGIALIVPVIGAALPLLYYYVLGHTDPAWELASRYEVISRLDPLVLLAGFGPLLLIAGLGVRRPDGSVFEQALLLWVVACFVTYFVNDAFAPHALQGLSFPFAVLAVRGWRRLRLPVVLALLALLLVTVPGLAYNVRKFVNTAKTTSVQYYLTGSEVQAMRWIQQRAPAGGVLAPTPLAITIPSQTGRSVWVGHGYWSRDYRIRAAQVNALFKGRLRPAAAVRFVRLTGARILIGDCPHHPDLSRPLAPMLASVHRFGCTRVYVLAEGRSARR